MFHINSRLFFPCIVTVIFRIREQVHTADIKAVNPSAQNKLLNAQQALTFYSYKNTKGKLLKADDAGFCFDEIFKINQSEFVCMDDFMILYKLCAFVGVCG